MNHKEIMFGNFVYVENYKSHPNLINEPVKVVGIQERNEKFFPKSEASISVEVDKYNGVSQFNEFIKPIPLTSEWFRDFKFKELENSFLSERFKFMYKKGYNYWYVIDRLSLTYLTKIEFVHELQNFMFVMDSVELKLISKP